MVEYIVAIDVTRVRFPAETYFPKETLSVHMALRRGRLARVYRALVGVHMALCTPPKWAQNDSKK